ncbi:MAG: hypothetical protein JSU85_00310, partial [Candidatus Zixiibacteriota bacterium]
MLNYWILMNRNSFKRSLFPGLFALFLSAVFVSAGQSAVTGTPGHSVSFNGKFVSHQPDIDYRSISENGIYYCKYDIAAVGDEIRELSKFRFYADGSLLYEIEKAPGSDVYISNSGIVAFMDHTFHFKGELTIHFYSETGNHLYSKEFSGASLFDFSPSGEMFGVGTPEHLFAITPRSQKTEKFKSGCQFDISMDGDFVAVADQGRVYLYNKGDLIKEIYTDVFYARKIRISPDNRAVSLINKKRVNVYSFDGAVIFADTLGANLSFRDLKYYNDNIATGVHFRDDEYSKGILRVYSPAGGIIYESEKESKYIKSPSPPENIGNSLLDYDPVPWPFAPFDSMCTVWDHYEQHMSYGTSDWSYLHQGLDIITPINEPTYAVESG